VGKQQTWQYLYLNLAQIELGSSITQKGKGQYGERAVQLATRVLAHVPKNFAT
jgi:hypothetical protein